MSASDRVSCLGVTCIDVLQPARVVSVAVHSARDTDRLIGLDITISKLTHLRPSPLSGHNQKGETSKNAAIRCIHHTLWYQDLIFTVNLRYNCYGFVLEII